MDWLNIHTSVLDSAEFLTAEPVDRGTWLCLQRYCTGQENGGRILGAAAWTDRVWQQLAGVTLKEVRHECQLWSWEGQDLLVRFYNSEAEAKVQRLRGQAAAAGHASWQKRGKPSGEPHGSPAGTGDGIAKGNEKKGNEIKGNTPNPQGGAAGRVNGSGHRRSRPPKAGSVLPSEIPGGVGDRMIAVGALKGRSPTTPWNPRELEAMRAARLDNCAPEDFEAQLEVMGRYYHAKIPSEKDYRRRDLQTLLNNWTGELDRARAYSRDHNDGIQKP